MFVIVRYTRDTYHYYLMLTFRLVNYNAYIYIYIIFIKLGSTYTLA